MRWEGEALSLICAVFLTVGCGRTRDAGPAGAAAGTASEKPFLKIDRHPEAADYNRGILESLPTYDPDSRDFWQVDLRAYDLSGLDLSGSLNDLMFASFDDRTLWPDEDGMPDGFDPHGIMELGKNPGLGVRGVHEKGIDGRGVGIAVIDQTLLVDHREYAGRLCLYEEMEDITGDWRISQMHGAAMASLAVGKTVGVAPGADLYFIATAFGGEGKDFTFLARAVERILEVNRGLPEKRRIRVIVMAIGWGPESFGYEEITAAVENAKAAGLLIVCASMEEVHGFKFHGLGRAPMGDPENFLSYGPGMWWSGTFSAGWPFSDRLLVPMDARTTASPLDVGEYVFYRMGGWSWLMPYIAGVYALAVQVDPDITPGRFWSEALRTGRTIHLDFEGQTAAFGPIIDPPALISALR